MTKISHGPNGNGSMASLHAKSGAQLASACARTEEGARERLLLAAFALREQAGLHLRDAERKEERAGLIQAAIEAAEA